MPRSTMRVPKAPRSEGHHRAPERGRRALFFRSASARLRPAGAPFGRRAGRRYFGMRDSLSRAAFASRRRVCAFAFCGSYLTEVSNALIAPLRSVRISLTPLL